MAVISIRLNPEEERMIHLLSTHLEEDRSSLIKHSLREMYEDLIDREFIEDFEAKEKKHKQSFVSAEDILQSL